MEWIEKYKKIMESPHAEGRDGIHISAQLRVDAIQLQSHRIGWAASSMERAANRIDELEDMLMKRDEPAEPATPAS